MALSFRGARRGKNACLSAASVELYAKSVGASRQTAALRVKRAKGSLEVFVLARERGLGLKAVNQKQYVTLLAQEISQPFARFTAALARPGIGENQGREITVLLAFAPVVAECRTVRGKPAPPRAARPACETLCAGTDLAR